MGSPVPLMIAIAIYTSIMILMGIGGADVLPEKPVYEKPTQIPVIGEILGVLDVIWQSVIFIIGILTFNIPGIPTFVRIVVNMGVWGKMAWDVGGLIRGGK